MNLQPHQVERFARDGYLMIRQVFSRQEVARLRASALAVQRQFEESGHVLRVGAATAVAGDLLSKPALGHLVHDRRMLEIARSLLGGPPVYFGDSSLQVGRGQRGWHKDNRLCDRSHHHGLDWQDPYPILRFGLYLQDHQRHSGGSACGLAPIVLGG